MSDWQEMHNTLTKEWHFDDYAEAWAAAEEIVPLFDAYDHHPEITIAWGKLTVTSTTHDAGDMVTDKDHELAHAIDEVLG